MVEALGPYRILDSIGAGGIGPVYRARDTRHGRTVAVKVADERVTRDPERRRQFLADARAAADLSHPNIAGVYEVGEDQGHLFLAMEYVPGNALRALIGGRPLNPRRAIDIAIQVADALAEGHAAGIVHGDLRPDTILLTPKGHAKLLDFGLSAWTRGGAERRAAPTAADRELGTVAGTLAYLSPEQAIGSAIDSRTDIFSLGVILFEMFTGRPPFAGSRLSALLLQIAQAPAPVPSEVSALLPADVDPIVARALAKSFDQRYEAAATMAGELRAVAAILETRASAAEPMPARTAPERRGYGWAVVMFAIAALIVAGWFIWRS